MRWRSVAYQVLSDQEQLEIELYEDIGYHPPVTHNRQSSPASTAATRHRAHGQDNRIGRCHQQLADSYWSHQLHPDSMFQPPLCSSCASHSWFTRAVREGCVPGYSVCQDHILLTCMAWILYCSWSWSTWIQSSSCISVLS